MWFFVVMRSLLGNLILIHCRESALRQIEVNREFPFPVEHDDFTMVGHGERSNAKCGQFAGFTGCLRTELHNHVGLNGVNYAGLVYAHPVFHSCDRPSCPLCFKRGWAVRQAGHVKQRLDKACKQAWIL